MHYSIYKKIYKIWPTGSPPLSKCGYAYVGDNCIIIRTLKRPVKALSSPLKDTQPQKTSQ